MDILLRGARMEWKVPLERSDMLIENLSAFGKGNKSIFFLGMWGVSCSVGGMDGKK